MSDLKPCPFCGSKSASVDVDMPDDSWRRMVFCSNPDCILEDANVWDQDWNTRTEDPELSSLRARVKELEKLLRDSNRGSEVNSHAMQLAVKNKIELEDKLKIAVEALEFYRIPGNIYQGVTCSQICKKAEEALAKIKGESK